MLNIFNKLLWAVATAFIFLSGIYFTFRLNGVQFRFIRIIKSLFHQNNSTKGIIPIQSFLMTLGSRIGVGSIAGVALAIHVGGVGTIFWMWIATFISAPITYAETVLGIVYRKQDGNNYKGGPSYFIRDGLKKPFLGCIYALLIILSYIGGFLGIQANTITKAITSLINIREYAVGLGLAIITSFIIFKGLEKIATFTSKIVPIMTILYISLAFIVTFRHTDLVLYTLKEIIIQAFHIKPLLGGFLYTLIIGMQRGIFSSESGVGTGSIISSTTSSNNVKNQAYLQVLGVYITTLIMCTATAIIILTSNYETLSLQNINGIEMAQYAFEYHFGYFGNILLFVSIFLFSFTSILGGYYNGESSLKYFFNKKTELYLICLKIISIIIILVGAVTTPSLLWNFVDIFVASLVIINIYALISLRDVVVYYFKN